MLEPGWPKMAFIERRLEDDPTNWWAPNRACVEAMLRSTGLEVVGSPGHEIVVARRVGERQRPDELRSLFG
jgi:tRNA (mo5U34)-methyltransferase